MAGFHTPGPWKRDGLTGTLVLDRSGEVVANTRTATRSLYDDRANAALIAKAPNLYELVRALAREPLGADPFHGRLVVDDLCRRARTLLQEIGE